MLYSLALAERSKMASLKWLVGASGQQESLMGLLAKSLSPAMPTPDSLGLLGSVAMG